MFHPLRILMSTNQSLVGKDGIFPLVSNIQPLYINRSLKEYLSINTTVNQYVNATMTHASICIFVQHLEHMNEVWIGQYYELATKLCYTVVTIKEWNTDWNQTLFNK